MPGFRIRRINSQLLREISVILSSVIKEERAHEAIITSVDCTRDLKNAKVYYTTLNYEGRAGLAKALEKVAGAVRSALSRVLRLRTVPELVFVFDESEILARKMDQLLDRVAETIPEETKPGKTEEDNEEVL